ncbi:hypothetical protein [Shimia sp.]|uniref:hypothetical protein n=1 Tax=Shimia sp. TaxID=1954381 RepID=UPI003BA9B44E
MSDKEGGEGEAKLELARAAHQSGSSDPSDSSYEELLAKMQELQKKVQLMGPLDPDFDMKRFCDELEGKLSG